MTMGIYRCNFIEIIKKSKESCRKTSPMLINQNVYDLRPETCDDNKLPPPVYFKILSKSLS